MKQAMIVTVGTGIGDTEEGVKSLARGITKSIENSNPGYVVFLVTKESKDVTLPEIKAQYPEMPSNESVLIGDMNDVNCVYELIAKKICELKKDGYRVVVDFTSGTKAMSAGAVLAATKEFVDISYVSGKRINGKVVSGREKVLKYSPVSGMMGIQEMILGELFNTYQFDSCIEILGKLKKMSEDPDIVEKLDRYKQIANGYSSWDKFNHKEALDILRTFDNSLVNIDKNRAFLLEMGRKEFKDYGFLICDLLNNARRRIDEGKYDDAVARLYRLVELMAQYKLSEKKIDTSDVDTWQLQTMGMGQASVQKWQKWVELRSADGKITISLKKSYELLADLDDKLGKRFSDDRKLKDMLAKRNFSILAHGLSSIKKEDAERMLEKVGEYAREVVDNMDDMTEKSKFPKLT
ncbi:MAG: hypothetical protein DDT31_00736 [Syntrophomonadaceae bacterium]|nr:hypothetical protein [Bacillota bacterium]